MVAQPIEFVIDPVSETGKLLAHARKRPLRLTSGGQQFRLIHDANVGVREDPFAYYDPERAAAAWRATFGTLKGIDVEAFKAEMREQRGQDTPGRPGE